MPVSGGDVRATLTLDASGYSEGITRAMAELSAFGREGRRATQEIETVESGMAASASAIAASMSEAGRGSAQLDQLAARADQAGARVDLLSQRASEAGDKLAAAMEAARESGAALDELGASAQMDAENLAEAQAALEALQESGTATADELREAQAAVDEFSEGSAALESATAELTAAHEANTAAVAAAEARYRQLMAQLNGAQAAAEAAQGRFAALTDTLEGGAEGGGLAGLTGLISQLGSSTLTSASRSLGTMAVNAAGLQSSTLAGLMASRALSTTLRTLVSTLGMAKFGLVAAGGAALYAGVKLIEARTHVEDSTESWGKLYEAMGDRERTVDFKAIANAEIELETTGLGDQVTDVYTQIAKALTDGEPDTASVIAEIQENAQSMFGDVRQRIQSWYDTEMSNLDLNTESGLQRAQELTAEYKTLMDRVDQLDESTGEFIVSWAGRSTEECKNALTQLKSIEEEAAAIAKHIDEMAALASSNQRAAYLTASAGLTTDQTTVANAVQYVKYAYTVDLDYETDLHEDRLAELWHQVAEASTDAEREALEAQLADENAAFEAYAESRQAEYRQQLAEIIQGVAESAARADPELAAAIQRAITGDFESLGELSLDNPALVETIRNMVEAGLLEGVTDADLSTAEGQMRALVQMLGYGLEDVQTAWDQFSLAKKTPLGFVETDDTAARLREWAQGIRDAAAEGDPEAVRGFVESMAEALNPPGVEFTGDATLFSSAADWIASLSDAANGADLNPAMISGYTDTLLDLYTIVSQMNADDLADFPFLAGFASALTDAGLETGADGVADALADLYTRLTGMEPVQLPAPEFEEPDTSGLGWANDLDFDVPTDITVEPQDVYLPSPAELGFPEWGESLGSAAADALGGTAGEASAAAASVAGSAASGAGGATGALGGIGDNAGGAFVSGILGHVGAAEAAGRALARAAEKAASVHLDIHSPSRRMRKLGRYTGEGFALGIDDTVVRARQAVARMAGTALNVAGTTVNNNQRTAQTTINNPIVRDREDVRRLRVGLARSVNESNYGIT